MARKLWHVFVVMLGLVGLLLTIIGFMARGTSILLPGLGLIIAGELILFLGLTILAAAIIANGLLNRWRPYR